jgi:hypothetical protein
VPRKAKNQPRKPATTTRVFDAEIEEDEEEQENQQETAAASTADNNPLKIPRTRRLPAEEFESFLLKYPETDGTMFYLYRLEPKIDRTYTAGDAAETNIDKGKHQKFSLPWLRQTWGSGRYQVRFKDASKQVCDSIIDINEYTEFPPILDVRELVDCDANRPYINNLIARGKAYRDQQGFLVPMDPNKKPLPGEAGNNAEVVDRVLSFAEKTLNRQQPGAGKIEEHAGLKAVDMMATANGEIMKQFFSMLAGNKGEKGDTTLLTSMLTMLMNSQQQQQTLMLKMMEMSMQKGGGKGTGIGDVLDLVDRLTQNPLIGRLFGGGAADVPWWQALIEKVAPDVAGTLKAALAMKAQQQAQQTTAAPRPAAPVLQPAAPAAPTPQPAAPAAAPATRTAADGIPAGQDHGIPASAEPAAAVEVIPAHQPTPVEIERAQVIQLGQQMLEQIERGQPGDRLADAIDTFYGFTAYARIAGEGKEGILARLNTIPEFAAAIAMMSDEVNQYIEEFVSYGQQKTGAAA